MSSLKSSLIQGLAGSQLWTIRPTHYLTFLHQIQSIVKYESRPLGNRQYRLFLLSKLALYCLILGFILQLLLTATLLIRGRPIEAHLFFDPLFTILVQHFPSLNYFTLLGFSLESCFPLYLDYAISFRIDFPTLQLIHQLALTNDQEHTGEHLRIPSIRLTHPLDSFTKWKTYLGGLWNPVWKAVPCSRGNCIYFFNASPKIRSRLCLLSTRMDYFFMASILAFGKLPKIETLFCRLPFSISIALKTNYFSNQSINYFSIICN